LRGRRDAEFCLPGVDRARLPDTRALAEVSNIFIRKA
jgi:hypothetical protein